MLIPQTIVDVALNNIMSQPNFADCIALARRSTKGGKLYLAGGKVYRSIIEALYGYNAKAKNCDFDFVTTAIQHTELKDGWRLNEAKGKEPYVDSEGNKRSTHFINERYGAEMDIVYIPTIIQVKEGELPNSIDGYFRSVPLDVQAIAIDCETAELIGRGAQESILSKCVKANNMRSLRDYCVFKHMNEESYIRRKAESLMFSYMWANRIKETVAKDYYTGTMGVDTTLENLTFANVAPAPTNPFPV